MRTLGVVIAGGRSSRFGSDKAMASFAGRTLMDHALAAVARHADAVAVVGRACPGVIEIDDYPAPGLGPLGGLAGALRYARANGFAQVLSCGVDCIDFPAELLTSGPAYFETQPVLGLWPADAAPALEAFLASDARRSLIDFARSIGAAAVRSDVDPANVNTPEDLRRLEIAHGL